MVVEFLVAVQVEVVHEENEVFGTDLSVPVFSFELTQFLCTDVARAVSVDSFERRVRLKVCNRCEYLAKLFDGKFILSNV